jgi:PIN domain nuclease of toxin-antitoxin system
LDQQSFEMLAITGEHAHAAADIPAVHQDPFDRMLIAQASVEGFTIVSRDAGFEQYKISLIKA